MDEISKITKNVISSSKTMVTDIATNATTDIENNEYVKEVEATIDKVVTNITNQLDSMIPNIILIISISVIFLIVIFGTVYDKTDTISVTDSFLYTVNPDMGKNKELYPNIVSVLGKFIEDYTKDNPLNDLDGIGDSFMFVSKSSFLVCLNVSNFIINNLANLLKLKNIYNISILITILAFIVISKSMSNIISFFADGLAGYFMFKILFSIFSAGLILFLLCFIVSIFTYMGFLIYGLFNINAGSSTNILRLSYIFLAAIIPIGSWISGVTLNNLLQTISSSSKMINNSIASNNKTNASSDCIKSYNWIFIIFFIFIIPFIASVLALGMLIYKSVSGIFSFLKDTDIERQSDIYNLLLYIMAYTGLLLAIIIIIPLLLYGLIPQILIVASVSSNMIKLYYSKCDLLFGFTKPFDVRKSS